MGERSGFGELAEVVVGGWLSLPPPAGSGSLSVEEAIGQRRSGREFASEALGVQEISQLLWAAQGITSAEGLRAAPSAGACYPLELYLVCEQGLFLHKPRKHVVAKVNAADLRRPLADAAYGQEFIAEAPISLVFAAVYRRTTSRYGERGMRYVHIDVGHAAQNVHLQAEALGLASVPVGAFDDAAVAEVLGLPADQKPVYIIPIGRRG